VYIVHTPHWLRPVSDNSTSGFPSAEYTACWRVLLNMSKCACTLQQVPFTRNYYIPYLLSKWHFCFLTCTSNVIKTAIDFLNDEHFEYFKLQTYHNLKVYRVL